ncbi:MAG: hypothetical protein A2293_00220 [Elusimicrobia bacterium RIFOXYB2_FULL_49_7]|nr:MAG: hypothetical protein A2293_00220 [Elusimicrobia bacterium RIFOXYB2_FULL_49_7]
MEHSYYTSGQVARHLRISTSTLKRWLIEEQALPDSVRNANGWRLFSIEDLERLRQFKFDRRRSGKRFNVRVLTPAA